MQATRAFKIICKHFLYSKYQVRGNKTLSVALISYASSVASDSSSIWLFITGFKVITRHQKTFQGCWKFLLSLLKPASLEVLTSGYLVQQTSAPHCHLSSAECPQQKLYTQVILPLLCSSALVPWVLGKFVRVTTSKGVVHKQFQLDHAERDTIAGLSQETWWLVYCS